MPLKDPMNWNIHKLRNLLTNDKVKFNSRQNELQIELDLKEWTQVSAFGFESANNFPHLDPESV